VLRRSVEFTAKRLLGSSAPQAVSAGRERNVAGEPFSFCFRTLRWRCLCDAFRLAADRSQSVKVVLTAD